MAKQYNNFKEMYLAYNPDVKDDEYDINKIKLERPSTMGTTDWNVYSNLYNAELYNQEQTALQGKELELAKQKADRTRQNIMSRQEAKEYYMGDALKQQGLSGSLKANVLTDSNYQNAYRNALVDAANEYSDTEQEIINKYAGLIAQKNSETRNTNAEAYMQAATNEEKSKYSKIYEMLNDDNTPVSEIKNYYEANKGIFDTWQMNEIEQAIKEAADNDVKQALEINGKYNERIDFPGGGTAIVYDGSENINKQAGIVIGSAGRAYNFASGGVLYDGEYLDKLTKLFEKAPKTDTQFGRKFIEYNGQMYCMTDDGRVWKLPKVQSASVQTTNQSGENQYAKMSEYYKNRYGKR